MLTHALRALVLGATVTTPPRPLGLAAAIDFAVAHEPAVFEARAVQETAAAQVGLRRTAYLPALDLFAEENAAGIEPVSGLFFQLPGVPETTGAPGAAGLAMDSSAGGSLDWKLDLFHRIALVDVALARQQEAARAREATDLDVGAAAADRYLALAEAQERVRADRVTVERALAFQRVVDVLVAQQLRPAADASRAAAILSLARVALARSIEQVAVARAALAVALGAPGAPIELSLGGLLGPPPPIAPPPPPKNPHVLERSSAVRARRLGERAVAFEYLPRLDLVAALWARGSGFPPDPAAGAGPLPSSPAWAVGLVLSWNAFSVFAIHERQRVAAAETARAEAAHERVAQAVEGQLSEAEAALSGAIAIAEETPLALAAARVTEAQALARYQAGLVTVVDVAEAERILARAEVEDAVARLQIRRAHLLIARAVGDLSPFVAEARAAQVPSRGGSP